MEAQRELWKHRLVLIALCAAAALALLAAGCEDESSNGGAGGPGANEVWMENSRFNPDDLTIMVGTTITWFNRDGYEHDVTSGVPGNNTGYFASGVIEADSTYSFTFDSAGTFDYYCSLHADVMLGSITVE